MDILYLLIPLSLALTGVIVWALLWAVRSGQFDDLEGPAYRVLLDDDDPVEPQPPAPGEREPGPHEHTDRG
ncbi:MAG: cbb3-type cytochrome oxidase assembly protein CcoS [Gammaproteobacteria bacterium]|nr:cbb3-type cytochrome oxidase assembly protein CcoS [Gammaproteobacteria bacterium]